VVNLPAGSSITYTIHAQIDSAATGTLSNTATVVPQGVNDSNPANNSATDVDSLTPTVDLSLTIHDGVETAMAGSTITYNIDVVNHGPSDVRGATFSDKLTGPHLVGNYQVTGTNGFSASGSGEAAIADANLNIVSGGDVTYTVTVATNPAVAGALTNTAAANLPDGTIETHPADNSATDTNQLLPSADLAVAISDGRQSAAPGGIVTYTITVSNNSSTDVVGARVADYFPMQFVGSSITPVRTTGGVGTITLSIGPSTANTYVASQPRVAGLVVASAAPGSFELVRGMSYASETALPAAGSNSSNTGGLVTTGSGTLTLGSGTFNGGGGTLRIQNGVLTNVSYTATGTAGTSGYTAAGTGNINDLVNIPAGGSITYTVTASISATATGTLFDTVTVTPPATVIDPNPGNNSATDSDPIIAGT
jgi:uncharacterized repeat protein (TIGR01451 family)